MAVQADILRETGGFSEKYGVAGDTEFLQKCIRHFPGINVVFLDDMEMVHLEIKTVCDWLRKIHIYGQYNRRMENSLIYRQLDFKTRLKIYASCAARNHYSVPLRIYSLLWLALGNLIYVTGRLKAKTNINT